MSLKKRFWNIAAVFLMILSTIAPIGNSLTNLAYADESISPISSKTKRDNGDGTYTISLSVKGTANTETTKTDVNVLVVFDTSGSMNNSTTFCQLWLSLFLILSNLVNIETISQLNVTLNLVNTQVNS